MFTQYNDYTNEEINKKRKIEEPSLAQQVLENNHRKAAIEECRKVLDDIIKEPADKFRRPSLREIK